jgi:hypothetical protein
MEDHTVRDAELAEKNETTHQEALHYGKLTAEELEIEKKLRRKIDIRIMPLVILVYLMNYIDRSVAFATLYQLTMLTPTETIMRPPVFKASLKISISLAINTRSDCPFCSSVTLSCKSRPISFSTMLDDRVGTWVFLS